MKAGDRRSKPWEILEKRVQPAALRSPTRSKQDQQLPRKGKGFARAPPDAPRRNLSPCTEEEDRLHPGIPPIHQKHLDEATWVLCARRAQPGAVWVTTHAGFKPFNGIPAPNPWDRRHSSVPRARYRSTLTTATLQPKLFRPQSHASVQTLLPEPDERQSRSPTLCCGLPEASRRFCLCC